MPKRIALAADHAGYEEKEKIKKTLDENEAYAFLAKPFTLPLLASKVKEQLAA